MRRNIVDASRAEKRKPEGSHCCKLVSLHVREKFIPGAKTMDTLAVPNLWMRKRATIKPIEIEAMLLLNCGATNARPETADVTDTAGVSIPSAKVNAVPKRLCEEDKSHGRRIFSQGRTHARRIHLNRTRTVCIEDEVDVEGVLSPKSAVKVRSSS